MSAINIQIVDVTISQKASKGPSGVMNTMNIVYKNLSNGDKIESKVLYEPYANKDLWATLEKSPKDTIYSVDREKDKKEGKYWDWVAVHRQDGMPAKSVTATRPTYETPDERAMRQTSIVRQSSLKSAVDLLRDHTQDVEIVINVARQFEAYVNGTTVEDIVDDIPY